jgi:putative PIN family toxin of toxin-antitoxin system
VRVILDTNILVSALITRGTPPDRLYEEWRHGRFALVSCEVQLDELRGVVARPFFQGRIKRSEAGRMINSIRRLALVCDVLPALEVSADPDDDYLLSLAQVSGADYLVTGDKSHLLVLGRHAATQIVSARELIERLGR